MAKTILVTGGAGFIGSNFVGLALEQGHRVVVLDALTYAGHLENLSEHQGNPSFAFVQGDIQNHELVLKLLREHKIEWVAHFAAESHVDKSITGPSAFVETNINGTFQMLNAAKTYFDALTGDAKSTFRFLHVSTDEVFGSLGPTGKFSETTPYQPNSPYSASKAASDLMVQAAIRTHKLDGIVTRCTNNYGPNQYPEKVIPVFVTNALDGEPLPLYDGGTQVRDEVNVRSL